MSDPPVSCCLIFCCPDLVTSSTSFLMMALKWWEKSVSVNCKAAVILLMMEHAIWWLTHWWLCTSWLKAPVKQSRWCRLTGDSLACSLMDHDITMESIFEDGWDITVKCLNSDGSSSLNFLHDPNVLPTLAPFWCFLIWPIHSNSSSSSHSPDELMLPSAACAPGTMRMPLLITPTGSLLSSHQWSTFWCASKVILYLSQFASFKVVVCDFWCSCGSLPPMTHSSSPSCGTTCSDFSCFSSSVVSAAPLMPFLEAFCANAALTSALITLTDFCDVLISHAP